MTMNAEQILNYIILKNPKFENPNGGVLSLSQVLALSDTLLNQLYRFYNDKERTPVNILDVDAQESPTAKDLELITFICQVRVAKKLQERDVAAARKEQGVLLEILHKKEQEKLETLSVEELKARLAALNQ